MLNPDRHATFGGSRRRTLEVCISRQCIVPSPVFFAYFACFAVKPSLPRLCEPPKAAWQSRDPPIIIFYDTVKWLKSGSPRRSHGSRRRTLEVCISRQCIVLAASFFAYFACFEIKPFPSPSLRAASTTFSRHVFASHVSGAAIQGSLPCHIICIKNLTNVKIRIATPFTRLAKTYT